MKGHLKPTDDCENLMNPATWCPMCRCREPHSPQCSAYAAYGPPSFPVCSAAGALQYSTVQYSTVQQRVHARAWPGHAAGWRRVAAHGAALRLAPGAWQSC